ncbi:serine hydrolase [Streptomyces sp. NPDC006283]|uniref:serine hydrolase n=1 Tax=Streptomyces sp. NPDC006283 TaxID=3156741 RepID=UPI0033A7960C
MGVERGSGHRRRRTLCAAVLASLLVTTHVTAADAAVAPPPPPQLTDKQVNDAVARLDGMVLDGMKRTGVPGVAVAVVHEDRVIHIRGFGEREAGKPGAVTPDTVFQLASVSKPMASTVVAGAVGDKAITWDDPVVGHLPGFALKDRWVTEHVTVADLFSHRSGLPEHAGDLLEDLGYDRDYVLSRLRHEPLTPFRASYAYNNFGVTAASEAVANAKNTPWEQLCEDTLYAPAGMHSTSSRFADYEKAGNKAVMHVKAGGTWEPKYVRDTDVTAPAGGVSSTARDMTRWMRLQLAGGSLGDDHIIPTAPLSRTHLPEIDSHPPANPAGRTGFYGLGWNVGYDDRGRLRLGHSGAFNLGVNTNVSMLPSEELGIVVLTNGEPVGLADAIAVNFYDTAQYGKPTDDWLTRIGKVYQQEERKARSPTDYTRPPSDTAEAQPDDTYTGTYRNDYYGPLAVTAAADGRLTLQLGPKPQRFPLTHYDGNTFSFTPVGENAAGPTGVTFTVDSAGKASKVRVESLDKTGLGTFTREERTQGAASPP